MNLLKSNVTLPYNAQSEQKVNIKNSIPAEEEVDQVRKLKILIAEDDKISDKLLTMVVSKFCKEVLKVRSGDEAVEVCHQNPDID